MSPGEQPEDVPARAPGPAAQALAAVRLREEGRPREARELLLPLCAAHPEDAGLAYQTAWVHDVLGLEAEAVPHYRRALALPGLAEADRRGALLGLGSTYRVLGRPKEALELALAVLADTSADPGIAAYRRAIRHYADDLDDLS